MKRHRHALILVLLMGMALLGGGYFHKRLADERRDARLGELMARLDSLEVALDREMVRLATLRLADYDRLVRMRKALEKEVRELQNLEGVGRSRVFAAALEARVSGLRRKFELMEQMKFRAAVIRNSLAYLPELVQRAAAGDPTRALRLTRLLERLYQAQLFPDMVDAQGLLDEAERLERPAGDPALDAVQRHFAEVANQADKLQALVGRFEALGRENRTDPLRAVRARHRAEMGRWNLVVGLALVGLMILILGWLWTTLRHLEQTRAQAERSRARLADAVNSLGEGFALFDRDHKLVLANPAFSEFYPWLGKLLRPGVHRQVLQRLLRRHLRCTTPRGEALACPPGRAPFTWIEQLDNGRWYLASNRPTSEGGELWVRTDITVTREAAHELRKLERAMEQSPVSIVITDVHGRIEYVNPKFEAVSGYSAAELIGNRPSMLKGGDYDEEAYARLWETILSGREWKGVFHNRRKDGTMYWESALISPIRDESGMITHFIGIKEDITQLKAYQESLRLSATVFEATNEGIILTDAEGRVRTVNPAFSRITGYQADEVLGRPAFLFDPARRSEVLQKVREELRQSQRWSGEITEQRKDGSWFHQWLSVTTLHDAQGQVSGHVIIFSDITRHKADQARILYQANYDLLTGLPNRTLLMDRLRQAVRHARRAECSIAVLFVDLDRFKAVNDLHGHRVGDDLLQEVAGRLRRAVRELDTVARFGGDEFVVLLHELRGEQDAALVANKIIETLSKPFRLGGRNLTVGVSLGVTLYPRDLPPGEDLDEICAQLLSHADMAMYQAKGRGGSHLRFFEPAMEEEIRRNLQLEQDLRQALSRGELSLHYQPIVDGRNERLVAAEALMRWHHPRLGMVGPERFIPLAEETGLIHQLGAWALRRTLAQLRQWHDRGLVLDLSLNLSARQRDRGFDGRVLAALLNEAGVSARHLTLEITENLLLEESDAVLDWLHGLKETGVRLAVDDFGTGYSSLSYLKRFPVDALKVDRSFVRDLPADEGDASLVKAILAMARSLDLKVVAEGVEQPAQRDFLLQAGCRYLQGYLYGPPLPAEAFFRRFGKT